MPKTIIPTKITARWLLSIGACDEDVATFANAWPDGISRVTVASIKRANRLGLSVSSLCGVMMRYYRYRAMACMCGGSAVDQARRIRALQKTSAVLDA